MPDVKIKKSVLQSIIRKSLRESGPKGTHDVPQRLTVGPDDSRLPSMLPLSPSDRMSTQLDIERPAVEDPEYVPANSRELGYALQALSEMVPDEQVEKAYIAFQKIVERLEEEGSDDEEVQLESMRRKNVILRALMESQDDDDDDDDLTPEEREELERIEREEATGPDAMYFKYERVLNAYRLSKFNFMDMYRLTQTRDLTIGDLEDFLDLLGSLKDDAAIVARVGSKLRNPGLSDDGLIRFISRFKEEQEERAEQEEARQAAAAQKPFEWQTAAQKYAYSGASGIRQAFLRDVALPLALESRIATRDDISILNSRVAKEYLAAMRAPENQNYLKTLLEEEGLTEIHEYLDIAEKLASSRSDDAATNLAALSRDLIRSDLFRNFAGLIRYETLNEINNFKFKPIPGQKQRTIGGAILAQLGLAAPDEGPPTSREEKQIQSFIKDNTYMEIYTGILDFSRSKDMYRSLIAAAAAMTADDADFEDAGQYTRSAFSTLKKAASIEKPASLHIADYLGKDDPLVAQVHAADLAARKAGKKAGKAGK